MSKIIRKYSKSYNDVIKIKKNFFEENKKNLLKIVKINKYYTKQKKRKICKICFTKLPKSIFLSHNVAYTICKKCFHLNGLHQDTKKFAKYFYSGKKEKFYYNNYKTDYKQRINKIYLPKLDFLNSVVKEKKKILEIGSGAGHFLKACENSGVNAIGYESNVDLVKIGNKQLTKNQIKLMDVEKTYQQILNSDKNVLVLISVLEHLENPHKMLRNFSLSKIKYLYISVPLFSLSSIIENSFKNIFPRQLAADHTHLFTKESLDYIIKKYKFKVVGEWWFGADFPDFYRSILNSSNSQIKTYKPLVDKYLYSVLDQLQNILDKNKICSQVHMILKK